MSQHKNSTQGDMNAAAVILPEARSRRWQPIRGCLLNVYRYDYEEFRYEQGRLLLRGNNGTGKSRILALQLPFLLDGEIASHRLEPDGDPAKRMEWNLLLGKHQDRLGYTCIEFGRCDSDGSCHYLTLGCGLYAVEHRGIHNKWFFITSQRIGHDLPLTNSSRQPLTRTQLEIAIGDQGEVFTSAESYRHAVDQSLFRLGDRYNTLIELLIRLRQPKLSKDLDEQRISDALSDALPPISNNVLDDVAEAFGTLETDRHRLDDFKAARDGVQAFLLEYRSYVQIAARRRADAVRNAHSEYEATQRRLRRAETDQELGTNELLAIDANLARLKEDLRAADEIIQTLSSSPQMRDARELDDAHRQAEEQALELTRAESDYEQAATARTKADSESETAHWEAAAAWEKLEGVVSDTQKAASLIGLVDHQRAISRLSLPQSAGAKTIELAKKTIDEAAARHRRAIMRLKEVIREVEAASTQLKLAKATYSETEIQLSDSTQNQRDVFSRLKRGSEELLTAFEEWLRRLKELKVAQPEIVAEELGGWCESGNGECPITAHVRVAADAAVRSLNDLRAERQQQLSMEEDRLHSLEEQRRRIEAGYHEPPPVPHTRQPEARASRSGAPLWSLCDFRAELSSSQRAALEAAMEAAGLLDAWIMPDGKMLDAAQQDTVLVPGTSPLPPDNCHLGLLLCPVVGSETRVAESIVLEILRYIGVGSESGPINVDVSGQWQLGPLHGCWSKAAAQHIGPAAQAEAKSRRLAELRIEIDETAQRIASIQNDIFLIEARANAVRAEAETAPIGEPIKVIHTELALANKAVDASRVRLKEAEHRVEQCRSALEQAIATRDRDASDLGLSPWVNKLSELDESFTIYRERIAELWPTLQSYYSSQQQAEAAKGRATIAHRYEQSRVESLSKAREKLAAATAKRDTLNATKGVEVKEIVARLDAGRRRCELLQNERETEIEKHAQVREKLAAAKANIDGLKELLERSSNQRAGAITVLRSFAATRLLATAHENLSAIELDDWSVTRAVEIARAIDSALNSVQSDDAAWDRNQREIHQHIEQLKDSLLPHSYSPVTRNTEEGVFVVSVPFHGRECDMVEFRAALSNEIDHHQMILDAKEREVLENHLVGEVATHLHDLLRNAEKLVQAMSNELHARPTSTGMKLRFTWEPVEDGPPGLHEARKRLLGHGGTWSQSERAALGEFLQQRIREVRLGNQTGTWHEHLSEAFDYRKWHRFGIERHQDGHWKPLNRRTYGTGSSGEKAIALTLPMLAAAAASYRSADPLAPRLILLDEAFVSIDKDMRSKCMGLLDAFDLDFVMTSENEWGCYPTLPALAIYQLSTLPNVDAVGVTRWVWNGRERRRDQYQAPAPCPQTPAETSAHSNGNGYGDHDFLQG